MMMSHAGTVDQRDETESNKRHSIEFKKMSMSTGTQYYTAQCYTIVNLRHLLWNGPCSIIFAFEPIFVPQNYRELNLHIILLEKKIKVGLTFLLIVPRCNNDSF